MRSHLSAITLLCLLSLEILLAAQVYPQKSTPVLEDNVVFDLHEVTTLKSYISTNVKNGTFSFVEHVLEISAERGQDPSVCSVFDVFVSFNHLMSPYLNMRYSMMASQLDVMREALRMYFTLTNGTHTIVLMYTVGIKEQDRIPDPNDEQYSYVFYHIGESADMWLNGERNLWNDLSRKNISVTHSWKITRIIFGIISCRGEPNTNHIVKGFFNAKETILSYQNVTYVELMTTDSPISWQAIMVMALVVSSTLILLILKELRFGHRMKWRDFIKDS